MLIPWVSIAWSMIQVSLIASIALVLAWTVRGRYPQIVASILSGSCVACLFLGLLVWIPKTQWSMVHFAPKTATESASTDLVHDPIRSDSDTAQTKELLRDSLEEGAAPSKDKDGPRWGTERLREWIASRIQSVEGQMRAIEELDRVRPTSMLMRVQWPVLAGLALAMLLWLYGFSYVRWVIRGSRVADEAYLLEMIAESAREFGLKRLPEVRVSELVPIGATVGWYRCMLLLHPSWQSWSESELRAVLNHELAHAARKDFLWVILSGLARVLFFFNPLIHMLVQRLRLEQELAADQLAAGMMGSANAYGRALARLALRSQHSIRAPRPMLAADRICVVRRITMLKQGSVQPTKKLWRWASSMSAVTVLVALPLSGLRGMTQDGSQSLGPIGSNVAEASDAKLDSDVEAKRKAEDAERMEAERRYPPLEFVGPGVYRPGRFHASDFGETIAWYQNYATLVLAGRSISEDAEIHGRGTMKITWSELTRTHGRLITGFSVKQADQMTPGLLSDIVTSPMLGPNKKLDVTKEMQNRIAKGIGKRRYESGSQKEITPDDAESWLIDDEKGFFQGTEQELDQYLQGEFNPSAEVPAPFLADYQRAAFASVFTHCKDWKTKMIDFWKGSAEEAQMGLVLPIVDGLQELGIFVMARKDNNVVARAIYGDSETALSVQGIIQGLVTLGKGALNNPSYVDEDKKAFLDLLDSLVIEQRENELQLSVQLKFESSMDEFKVAPGWMSFSPKTIEPDLEPKSVALKGDRMGAICGLLAQSIQAQNYLGKQVRLEAEIACPDEAQSRAGLFLLTSGEKNETKAYVSQSIDRQSNMESVMKLEAGEKLEVPASSWSTIAIDLNVPEGSQVLSFGCYHQDVDIRVRNIRLTVIGEGESPKETVKPFLAVNPFRLPGDELTAQPVNMDFSQVMKQEPKSDSKEVPKVAEQPAPSKVAR